MSPTRSPPGPESAPPSDTRARDTQAGDTQAFLARAEALCVERGARLTEQRRRVLEILFTAGRPSGAYEILEAMRDGSRPLAPPTVYRALDFLLEQGLVHKIESLHAFVGCDHPGQPHASQFLICDRCGGVTELEDEEVARSLSHAADGTGFHPARRVVELIGVCADCSGDATATPGSVPPEADGG